MWKGKLILTYPNDDDAVLYLFTLIVNQYGWPWIEKLSQQDVHWVRGTATSTTNLDRSTTTAALSFSSNLINSTHLASKQTVDHHVQWPQTAGIFASTDRPESAKLFLSWLMSDEMQASLAASGSQLTRAGIINTTAAVWEERSVAATQFAKFMSNREVVKWWRFQFETALGTVQGASPLTYGI